MDKSKSGSRFWPIFAALVVTVIILGAIRWSLAHPYGIHWDEGSYINDVRVDLQRLQTMRMQTLARRIMIESSVRPPAYRLIALPFLLPFGYHVTLARLSSLACFALSALFINLATLRIGSRVAASFAVLIFALSPEVISASIFFSTDTPVFLAISAVMYYLFVHWTDPAPRPSTWIGLGLAIGLGFWSKTSFLMVAFPLGAFALFYNFRKQLGVRGLMPLIKAASLGFVIAAPWWILNLRNALGYAQFARGTTRNSLGTHSLSMFARWIVSVFEGLLGHGIGILILLLAVSWFYKSVIGKRPVFDALYASAVGACACAGIPLVLAQLTSTNNLLRYLTPAMIPLAIAAGLLADSIGWTRSKIALGLSFILFCVQLGMIVYPVAVPNTQMVDMGLVNGGLPWREMSRFDQWDWRPLREISAGCGVEMPKISFLGGARPIYPPQIVYPWVAAATSTRLRDINLPPDPVWLWRYEDGAIDWQKVMDSANQSDIVLTLPGYIGETRYKENLDNQYNAEFAQRLSQDDLFRKPMHLTMGRFTPVDVLVFVKKSLPCPAHLTPVNYVGQVGGQISNR